MPLSFLPLFYFLISLCIPGWLWAFSSPALASWILASQAFASFFLTFKIFGYFHVYVEYIVFIVILSYYTFFCFSHSYECPLSQLYSFLYSLYVCAHARMCTCLCTHACACRFIHIHDCVSLIVIRRQHSTPFSTILSLPSLVCWFLFLGGWHRCHI